MLRFVLLGSRPGEGAAPFLTPGLTHPWTHSGLFSPVHPAGRASSGSEVLQQPHYWSSDICSLHLVSEKHAAVLEDLYSTPWEVDSTLNCWLGQSEHSIPFGFSD